MAAAEEEEEKAILAVIHRYLLQVGYSRAAKMLLEESGQKTFPSFSVPLQEIFAYWNNRSQPKKRKAADRKRKTPAKIRVPDPKSSSESSEEEDVTNAPKANVPANNSSVVNAESSSDDEDSSSEEEAVAEKMVKTSVTRSKPSDFLQLAAQKTNSFPGKGVAVASVQAKGQQNKASVNKLLSPAVAKMGQNEDLPGKLGPVSQSPVVQGWNVAHVTATKTGGASKSSSSSSSSSSESEEEKTLKVVKTPPPPKPAQKESESSNEDSSDDSDSEDGGATAAAAAKAATIQLKPGVQSTQVKTTLAKSLPASAINSKGSSIKVSPAKIPANQIRSETENAAKSTEPTESSETSNSSDSEDAEPSSVAQTKSPRKIPQAATAVVKNEAASKPSSKTVSVSSPLKQTPKPSLTKSPIPSKKAESSESNESSSESEDETHPVPVSQKGLQTPQHSAGAKQNHADKPGNLVKAASSILKGKEAESESSSSSDSEDETVPAALKSPPPSATKANTPAQPSGATKSLPLQVSLQKAQQSEDSSQDSSDETDSEEDTVLTQKPSRMAQKPVPVPMKATTAKSAGVTPGKAGSALSARKGTANATKSAAASLQKASDISETDSSESSNSEAAAKPVKQPPIHPFFKQVAGKAASASAKGAQVNSGTSESVSSKCQSPATVITGKVEQNSSKKAKPSQDQTLPSKPSGPLKGKESSGSSSSSHSEEEEAVTASATVKQIPQPGLAQKGGVIQEVESSSEESSDEDQEEPSQSVLGSPSGPFKTPTSTVLKTTSPVLSKQTPGKAGNLALSALTKSSGKSANADSSSSDSSDSDTDAEETIAQKAEITSLPASGKQAVVAKEATCKGTVAGGKRSGRDGSKASTAKKTTAKTQSNGKAKGTPAANFPLTLLPKVHPVEIDCKSNEGAVAQVPGTGGATSIVAMKTPKATKMSKSGEKKKPSKKRKLAAGGTVLGEPKEKKHKEQSILDMLTKKKKKKKSKSSNVTKPPKNKDSKEKKSDKKKKKNKKLESLSEDGSQKKKKKKKKTGDLETAA
ncbi:treacle protein isoform X3 [Sceloporus undulatus]|uniref:treacle protein isoform X3 n=1 Tax=Sceloporus undulatus TaxID=8520 RepID=UPI001C4C73C3|nr:treacle protein isoform X3 [Sceloporus undulatus]